MDEKADYEKSLAKLAGEVAALRTLVDLMVHQMPDAVLYMAAYRSRALIEKSAERVRQSQDDRARDFSEGVWNILAPLRDGVDDWVASRKAGERLTTIQAYPMDEDELMRLREAFAQA